MSAQDDVVERVARVIDPTIWEEPHWLDDGSAIQKRFVAHMRQRSLERARAAIAAMPDWQPIETAPPEEDLPFLVLLPKNDVAPFVVLQVTRFQGDLYPDHLNGFIGPEDAVKTATHWMPARGAVAKHTEA